MARVLVFTDRLPSDPEWKGALTWQIILGLAESQHEVLVITPCDLNEIGLTHSRLTVTRPLEAWRVDQMPTLARAILTYQPQVLHTFALHSSRRWPALTVWPYLNSLCLMIPGLKRFSTVFEEADLHEKEASRAWHLGGRKITVFDESLRRRFPDLPIEVVPLELEEGGVNFQAEDRILVPAPVSEWQKPEFALHRTQQFLLANPDTTLRIIGGWGDWTASQRKEGWRILQSVAARVTIVEASTYEQLCRELESSRRVWLENLHPESWRYVLSTQLAHRWQKPVVNETPSAQSAAGSTANQLSRLYAGHD